MDAMSSGEEYNDKPMYTEMLEDICGGIKYHTGINRRKTRYKIWHCIQQGQAE